jgi:phosphoribosylformylglycinamidine synthase
LTNLAAADVATLGDVKLSANWMAAAGFPGEDARLFDTVRAVSDLCQAIGVSIPVGKDSLSMRTGWTEGDGEQGDCRKQVVSPLSVIVTGFARVQDARRTLTPQLVLDAGETDLLLIDLGAGRNRLGGSALAQVHNATGSDAPDVDDPRASSPSSLPFANSPPTTCCSPTTIARTAGCLPSFARWPLPDTAAFRSIPTVCATTR